MHVLREVPLKVLVLSPYPESILFGLAQAGDEGIPFNGPPEAWPEADYIVSFGYRHIIKEPHLSRFDMRMLNIHLSYLPWNRGGDPNFWSFYDDTKKGVTIHYITEQLDHGPIAARVEAEKFCSYSTLRSSYDYLRFLAGVLFMGSWPHIREGGFETIDVDPRDGSYHAKKDLPVVAINYDMPVRDVAAMGRKARGNGA